MCVPGGDAVVGDSEVSRGYETKGAERMEPNENVGLDGAECLGK